MPDASVIKPRTDPAHKGLGLIGRIRRDPLGYFLKLGTENNGYTWLSFMGSPVLFLNDATAIEYVVSQNDKNYHKGKYNEGLRPLFGYSILLSEDDLWRKQRRDTAPVFSGGNFPGFLTHMVAATQDMLKRWEPAVSRNEPIDMHGEAMRLTLDVLLRSLFHEESEAALLHTRDAIGTMFRLAEDRIWSVASIPLKLALMLPKYSRTLKFLDQLTAELVQRRRENKAYPEDLLSRLIDTHADTAKDRKLLRDNIIAFLTAGHETTANTVAWLLFELGLHPEIRGKVIQEIDAITTGNPPDAEMLKDMKHVRNAMNETLRLYPPVWTMSRRVLADDIIPLEDGRKVLAPKDATVMLCTYSVQRREKYWQDPESFFPGRFAAGESDKRPKFSWFPFSGGPRLCLGFRFAEIEIMVAIAMIYQKFELKLIPGQQIRPRPMITLRPDKPVLFRVTHRKPPTAQES